MDFAHPSFAQQATRVGLKVLGNSPELGFETQGGAGITIQLEQSETLRSVSLSKFSRLGNFVYAEASLRMEPKSK